MLRKYIGLKDKLIYLTVGGYNLLIICKKTEISYIQSSFANNITKIFNKFILPEETKNIDFIIEVVDKEYLKTLYENRIKKYYISFYEEISKNKFTTYYLVSVVQFQLLLRTIILKIASRDKAFLLHASACLINNKALIFPGISGSGKSTIIKLLHSKFPAIADEFVFIKYESGNYYAYQTPFFEKEWWIKKEERKYEILSILFIQKNTTNTYFPLKPEESFPLLIQHIWKQCKTESGHKTILHFVRYFSNIGILKFSQNKSHLLKYLVDLFP